MKVDLDKIIRIAFAIMLISCLAEMPYSYYTLVRFVGMMLFVYCGVTERENPYFRLIWFASVVLINPIFKIVLSKPVWNVIDVIWAILLLVSCIDFRTKKA